MKKINKDTDSSSSKATSQSKKLGVAEKGKKKVSKAKPSKSSTQVNCKEPASVSAPPQYDAGKFRDAKSFEAHRDNFSMRPILMEKKFKVFREKFKTNEEGAKKKIEIWHAIKEEIIMRHWQVLCNIQFTAYRELVAEFYANASSPNDKEPFQSFVRGKMISFEPKTINQLLGIPLVRRKCKLNRPPTSFVLNVEKCNKELCEGKTAWITSSVGKGEARSLLTHSLSMKARAWSSFVQGVLLPIHHKSSITASRICCLQVLMKREFIDVGLTIASEIHFLRSRRRGSLGYAGIISQLCIEAGVPLDGLTKMRRTAQPMDLSWVFGVQQHKTTPRTPIPLSKEQQAGPSSSKPPKEASPTYTNEHNLNFEVFVQNLRVMQNYSGVLERKTRRSRERTGRRYREKLQKMAVHTHNEMDMELIPLLNKLNLNDEGLVLPELNSEYIREIQQFDEFPDGEMASPGTGKTAESTDAFEIKEKDDDEVVNLEKWIKAKRVEWDLNMARLKNMQITLDEERRKMVHVLGLCD